jgi:hypothetical protein
LQSFIFISKPLASSMRLRSASCWSRASSCAAGLVAFEAGHGHVEDRLQARGVDAFDDVGADPGLDRLAHHPGSCSSVNSTIGRAGRG